MAIFIHMLLMLSGLTALLLIIVHLGKGATIPDQHKQEPKGDELRKFILWKSFYVNPNDPRGWVEKTNHLGSTINFRSKKNAAIFAGLILWTMGFAIALAVTAVRTHP